MCMSFVAVVRSLMIVSYVAFKMAALWFWTMFNCNPPIAHCHPLLWGGGILVDHWSTIFSFDWNWKILRTFHPWEPTICSQDKWSFNHISAFYENSIWKRLENVNPLPAQNKWVFTEHCVSWCSDTKAPGHQYPQCSLYWTSFVTKYYICNGQ